MELIERISEVKDNAKTLSKYLRSESLKVQYFALNLVKNGKCFVCFESEFGLEFYPSKFIGYKNNNLERHERAKKESVIHGGLTTKRLNKLFDCVCKNNENYENEFQKFCLENKIVPKNQIRKFWLLKIKID